MPKTSAQEFKMQTVSEVVVHVECLIRLCEEQYELDKNSKLFAASAPHTWHRVQTLKALLCSITGQEYVYEIAK